MLPADLALIMRGTGVWQPVTVVTSILRRRRHAGGRVGNPLHGIPAHANDLAIFNIAMPAVPKSFSKLPTIVRRVIRRWVIGIGIRRSRSGDRCACGCTNRNTGRDSPSRISTVVTRAVISLCAVSIDWAAHRHVAGRPSNRSGARWRTRAGTVGTAIRCAANGRPWHSAACFWWGRGGCRGETRSFTGEDDRR